MDRDFRYNCSPPYKRPFLVLWKTQSPHHHPHSVILRRKVALSVKGFVCCRLCLTFCEIGTSMFLKNLLFFWQIQFEGEGERHEAGGFVVEFFLYVFEEMIQPDYGMFIYSEKNSPLWFPSRVSFCSREASRHKEGMQSGTFPFCLSWYLNLAFPMRLL